MSGLIYRRVFGDSESLRRLCRCEVPNLDDVRRRIFVAERAYVREYPDHFHKNYLNARLDGISDTHSLAQAALTGLANSYLERRAGRLRIRGDVFADWHQALPAISPLGVIVAFLVNEERGPRFGEDPRAFLEREIGDTALLAPYQPALEDLVERKGLNEMHMHLNGSTEIDVIWPDTVQAPERYLNELRKAMSEQTAPSSELYDQVEIGLRPHGLFRRLKVARRVRHAVAAHLIRAMRDADSAVSRTAGHLSEDTLLEIMDINVPDRSCEHTDGLSLSQHPSAVLFGPSQETDPLIDEAVLLYVWLQCLSSGATRSPSLGLALYFNFLVFNLVARISVQQVDEVGFDQFQKYTLIGVREHIEKTYARRFRQLNLRRPHRVLTHLEGRLSAKNHVPAQLGLLEEIVRGYLEYRHCQRSAASRGLRGAVPSCLTGPCRDAACRLLNVGREEAELSLVIHFIKREAPDHEVRLARCLDIGLRTVLERQARVVTTTREINAFARHVITGIDAAANELHAAPEVFAPTFRFLRSRGIDRATYHAGEDFVHLVSGIRATAEAQDFLSLGAGDRIGHATALGIRPRLWLERLGGRLMIRQGEHLDNLVFAHACLSKVGDPAAQRLLEPISKFAARIYEQEHSPALLHQAWKLRGLDILAILRLERSVGLLPGDSEIAQYAEDRAAVLRGRHLRAEHERIARAVRDYPKAYRLFRDRHQSGIRLRKLVEVQTDWIDADSIARLQTATLAELAGRGVIIESLPTSNLRISFYRSFNEHHLFRWLGLAGEDLNVRPAVCIGSDDTGIFATNLWNEYASVLEALCRHYGLAQDEALGILDRLNSAGFAYRFRPGSLHSTITARSGA